MFASRLPACPGALLIQWVERRVNRLRGYDRDSTALSRTTLPTDHDLDVLIERRQQVHKPLDGESRELVVPESRHLRLAQAEEASSPAWTFRTGQ
jgi:hypothetical protein